MRMSVLDIDEIIERENEKYRGREKDIVFEGGAGVAPLTGEEVMLINLRLGQIAENDVIFGFLWSARSAIYEMVGAVKKKLESNEAVFKGEYAEGKELDCFIARPKDIKKGGTALTDWLQSVSAGTAYYESDTNNAKLTLPDHEGRVYLGWVDTIDSPKLDAVMYELSRQSIIVETPFELCREFPAIRHRAIKVFPEDTYRIQVRYKASGDDEARPILVIVTTAEKKSL